MRNKRRNLVDRTDKEDLTPFGDSSGFCSVLSPALAKSEEKRETERKVPPLGAREEEDGTRRLRDVSAVGKVTNGRVEGHERAGEGGKRSI